MSTRIAQINYSMTHIRMLPDKAIYELYNDKNHNKAISTILGIKK